MSEGSRPPEDVQPLATPVVARRTRMHEFFRRRLQAAKEAGHNRAWIYRDEIVAEGEAMGIRASANREAPIYGWRLSERANRLRITR